MKPAHFSDQELKSSHLGENRCVCLVSIHNKVEMSSGFFFFSTKVNTFSNMIIIKQTQKLIIYPHVFHNQIYLINI